MLTSLISNCFLPITGHEPGPGYRGGAGLVPDLPPALHRPPAQTPQAAGQPRQAGEGQQDRDRQDGVNNIRDCICI